MDTNRIIDQEKLMRSNQSYLAIMKSFMKLILILMILVNVILEIFIIQILFLIQNTH